MSLSLQRIDNVASRKVAILFCNHNYKDSVKDSDGNPVGNVAEARQKTALMDRFLLETLGFDSVKTQVDVDLEAVHRILNELEGNEVDPWVSASQRKGSLLIFIYFMGYWGLTSGSQVFSVRGEKINLD